MIKICCQNQHCATRCAAKYESGIKEVNSRKSRSASTQTMEGRGWGVRVALGSVSVSKALSRSHATVLCLMVKTQHIVAYALNEKNTGVSSTGCQVTTKREGRIPQKDGVHAYCGASRSRSVAVLKIAKGQVIFFLSLSCFE